MGFWNGNVQIGCGMTANSRGNYEASNRHDRMNIDGVTDVSVDLILFFRPRRL